MDKPDKLTIVGGQATDGNNPFNFNTHIEKILIKAASDETFRKELMEDRKSALDKEDINPADKMLLGKIPLARLSNMIDKFGDYKSSRRNFLKGAAASAALLTGAFLLPASASLQTPIPNIAPPGGARPDPPVLSETIGPKGDTIDYNYTGLRLVIPEKALEKTVNITVSVDVLPGKEPENVFFKGYVYKFSPEDTKFSKEISIYFPAFGGGYGMAGYVWEKSGWKELPAEFSQSPMEQGWALVKSMKLGIYALGFKLEPTPSATRGLTSH